MQAGGITIILVLAATGAAVTIALIFLADARDWRRMRERMRHQRALADVKPWGDVMELPVAARIDAGGRRKKHSDRLAHDPMSLTHRGTSR